MLFVLQSFPKVSLLDISRLDPCLCYADCYVTHDHYGRLGEYEMRWWWPSRQEGSEHQNIINIDITLLTGAVQLGLVGVHLLVLLWIICQPTMDTEETSNNMNTSQSVLPGQKPPCLVNILWRNFLFPVIRLCWRWWPLATDHITMTRRAPDAPGVAEWYDGVSWCHGSTVYWRLL